MLIDALHRACSFGSRKKRGDPVSYLAGRHLLEDGPFWKLAQALFDVLPRDIERWKPVNALFSERPTLRAESRKRAASRAERALFD